MQKNPVWQHPITEELITTGPENPLGVRWISFWSDGQNQIGFHGTNQEELIGQAVSHGCLRMRNPDITALFAQVHLGTPITVQP
jgi:lipoprotein-anchoring transpeptidase ErfK/SrfK